MGCIFTYKITLRRLLLYIFRRTDSSLVILTYNSVIDCVVLITLLLDAYQSQLKHDLAWHDVTYITIVTRQSTTKCTLYLALVGELWVSIVITFEKPAELWRNPGAMMSYQNNEWSLVHSFTSAIMWSDKLQCHDDVIKWKHIPRYWAFVRGIHRSPVNSLHKGQWRGVWCLLLSAAD